MDINEKVIGAIKALQQAQNIETIFNIDLPAKVLQLDADALEEFREEFWVETAGRRSKFFRLNCANASVSDKAKLTWEYDNLPFVFSTFKNAVIDAETKAYGGKLPEGLCMTFRGGVNESLNGHLHVDDYRLPNTRIYLFRDETPSQCVSHEHARDVFSDLIEQNIMGSAVLTKDLQSADRLIGGDLRDAFGLAHRQVLASRQGQVLQERLLQQCEPLDAGGLYLMSGVTYHKKSPAAREGAIFQAAVAEL